MALKILQVDKFQPISLYVTIFLTICYFMVQMVVSNISHALTLTIDSYLVLCNLFALFGCLVSLKYDDIADTCGTGGECSQGINSNVGPDVRADCSRVSAANRLKNTFGWARVDILVMLMGCVIFASLCFSSVLEAVQTLFHITHYHEMHNPMHVFIVGFFRLLLNVTCYILIGGFTFDHKSFIQKSSQGLELERDPGNQSEGNKTVKYVPKKERKFWISEMFRDAIGCVLVMACALIVHFFKSYEWIKYADPIIAIISAILLLFLSYSQMKESCMILLQTIPDHVNIDCLRSQLLKDFPDIVNVHDLHVWQLTKEQTFATAHVIFLNPSVYTKIEKNVMDFFHNRGIPSVTIQPEFFQDDKRDLISANNCLMACKQPQCLERYCCDFQDFYHLPRGNSANENNSSKCE